MTVVSNRYVCAESCKVYFTAHEGEFKSNGFRDIWFGEVCSKQLLTIRLENFLYMLHRMMFFLSSGICLSSLATKNKGSTDLISCNWICSLLSFSLLCFPQLNFSPVKP